MRSIAPLFVVAFVASAPALAAEPIPVPQFDSVELRGGGSVAVVPGPGERVTLVEGSTQFTRFHVRGRQLVIDACDDRCPQHYRLRVQIESPRVPDLAVSGGGEIAVAPGFRPQHALNAAANGGGSIDARALEASDVAAAVNGGGELQVHAASTLSGAVSGGGLVRYWGNPRVTTAIQGGGDIRPAH